MKVKKAVYLNADGTAALPDGHQHAATLLVGINGTLSDEVAKRFGITEDGVGDVGADDGAPKARRGVAAHLYSDNVPDGINTAPGSPAATPRVYVLGKEQDSFGKTVPATKPVTAENLEEIQGEPAPKAEAPKEEALPAAPLTRAQRKAAAEAKAKEGN